MSSYNSNRKGRMQYSEPKNHNYSKTNDWDTLVNEKFTGQDEKVIGKKSEENNVTNAARIDNFENMNLKENLLRGIYSYGFEKPSKIQQCTIPVITQGKDIVAQSQSGTGKTGSFTIGILQRIN